MAKKLQIIGDLPSGTAPDEEAVKQIVDDYLEDNPPVPNFTINGRGPDENGNYVVNLTGIATNASDIDKLEASLAEGGATANAIAEAKKAGTDAKDHADGLNTAMNTRVEALESVTYVEITADEIDAMFD